MPVITLETAKLSKQQKQTLVKELTEAASRITGVPEKAFNVFLKENDLDNIGAGGVLRSESSHSDQK